jgi:hypothetical protein
VTATLTVGKLQAELGLNDRITKELGKVEHLFRTTAKSLDADGHLGLDMGDVDKARGQFKAATSGLDAKALVELDTSALTSGLAKAKSEMKSASSALDQHVTLQADVNTSKMTEGIDKGTKKGDESFFGMIGGWATAGPLAAAGVGLAVGVALLGAFNQVLDRQKSTSKLAASLGVSHADSARLGALAGQIYVDNFGESFAQVNQVLKGIGQQGLLPGWSDNDTIKKLTEQVLNFAGAFDQELDPTMRTVAQMLRTGMAPDAQAALDILSAGMKTGTDNSHDLLDTFNEYPTQFRALGLSGEMAMGLLSQGMKGGARDSDVVADSLKEFNIRAKDGSATTADGFRRLGLSGAQMAQDIAKGGPKAEAALQKTLDKLRGIKDPAERAAIAVELFGTQSEDMQGALMALDPSTAVEGLGKVAGAADDAGNTLNDNLGSQLDSIKRKLDPATLLAAFDQGGFEGVKAQIGGAVDEIGALWTRYGPEVTKALDAAKEEASVWWDAHGPEIVDKVGTWWDGTGSPALGGAIRAALGAAWDAGWNALKDKATDPQAWMDLAGLLGGFWQSTINGWAGSARTAVDNVMPSVWAGVKSGFAEAINAVISSWNAITFSTPDFPGTDWGGQTVTVPQISPVSLATGGFVTSPTLAVVGDAIGQGEIVAPERAMQQVVERALAAHRAGPSGFTVGDVNLYGVREPDTATEVVRGLSKAAYLAGAR